MSHLFTVVRLDVLAGDDIRRIADAVTEWLLATHVIAGGEHLDPLVDEREWQPAFGSREVVDLSDGDEDFPAQPEGVLSIVTTRATYFPGLDDEELTCASCGADAPPRFTNYLGEWLNVWYADEVEPTFVCDECGWSGLVGDWRGEPGVAVGAPAVCLLNWPPPKPAFVTQLRERLGGRTATVHTVW